MCWAHLGGAQLRVVGGGRWEQWRLVHVLQLGAAAHIFVHVWV